MTLRITLLPVPQQIPLLSLPAKLLKKEEDMNIGFLFSLTDVREDRVVGE